jgi:Protein of unknown function (DUF3592)
MNSDPTHWGYLVAVVVKLLAKFGLIPGTLAAFGIKKFWQKQRQKRAMDGWPTTEATIQIGRVHQEGRRYWAEITYSYFVGEYRSGTYIRNFRSEADAADFVRELKDRRLQVRYKEANPENSVILDRDLELIGLLAPQLR